MLISQKGQIKQVKLENLHQNLKYISLFLVGFQKIQINDLPATYRFIKLTNLNSKKAPNRRFIKDFKEKKIEGLNS